MEIERLHNVIGGKHKDLELLAQKHIEMEKSHSFHADKVKNYEKNEIERRINSERNIFEVSNKSLQSRIVELENSLSISRQEREKLFAQISEYNKLLDETKITISNLQTEHQTQRGSLQIEIQSALRLDYVNIIFF